MAFQAFTRCVGGSPSYGEIFEALPPLLDRSSVRRFCEQQSTDEDGLLSIFAASQVWGYGAVGYGPSRLGTALAHPDLVPALDNTMEQLYDRTPVEAFHEICLAARLPWVGTAFGTKFLYFADPSRRALILDSVVAKWLRADTGKRFDCNRHEHDYALWLDLASRWATDLGTSPEQVELLIFSDTLPQSSQWRPRSLNTA